MASNAEKLDPQLWEEAKADAREKFGGHSARAMQYAVKLYKERGGRYKGRKKADNRLTQWTEQDWTTKSGRPSRETGERYLPRAAIESLTPAEYGATSRAKRAGGGVGKVVAQPQSIREKTRKFRKVNPDMATPAQIAARKKFAERARSGELAKMRKKATKRNPAKTVSEEISQQMRKGKPQKQAVAIALEMERAGKLKKNPISDVAQTIYQQLGENRFVAMTGAKNLVGGENYLMFSIPRNMSPYNKVKITYLPERDLYDVDFMKVTRAGGVAKAEPYNDVYAEQLRELFRNVTGMETSLGTMGRRSNPTATRAPTHPRTNPDGKKFVVGKYYETRLITDSDTKVGALILDRTEKSVTVQGTDNLMKTKYRLTTDYQGNEMFFPWGRYSMAPQIGADDERKSNPTATRAPARARTKLLSNGREKNPIHGYTLKCSRSERTLGYADTMPMAKMMATAMANETGIPVQIVKA